MAYQAKNFDALFGTTGFSDRLLRDHFALYQGYTRNVNTLTEKMDELAKKGDTLPEYAELKRRFSWEFNGMRLHEHYFSAMKPGGAVLGNEQLLMQKIRERFGAWPAWEKEFKMTGAMRGIGWVGLWYDLEANRLFNGWIEQHHTGLLAGCALLLVMDVFEHAFLTDYGLDKGAYMKSYMNAVDWSVVQDRLDQAAMARMNG